MRALVAFLVAGCVDAAEPGGSQVVWEPAGPSAADVLGRFQRCLQYDEFFTTAMDRWAFEAFTAAGPCASCHNDYGMFSFDGFTFVDAMRAHLPNVIYLYTFHPEGDGRVVVNERGLRAAADGAEGHPIFFLDDRLLAPLRDYHARIHARMAVDDCPVPPLPRL